MQPPVERSDTFDVVVVGGGGSGLAAACTAAQHGAAVLLLEKQPHLGGTTGLAVGSFTAAGTAWQRAAGIDDTPQAHAEDAARFAAPDVEARNHVHLRRYFLQQAADTLHWLATLGLSFYGPSPEPPNRVPRMHNVVPGAKAYIAALQAALLRHGGQIVCQAAVTDLLWSADRVCGVVALIGNAPRRIVARRGVILAAGDYAANADLIARYKGPQFAAVEAINPHATGDGHLLAQRAGAHLLNMDITYGPELRFVAPPGRAFHQLLPATGYRARIAAWLARHAPRWLMRRFIKRLLVTWQHPEDALFADGAILVNQRGERFVDERRTPQRELAVAQQPGKVAYLVLDGRLAERYARWPHFISTAPDIAYAYVDDYRRLRPDVTLTGQSWQPLAATRGIDVAALGATLREFNDYVAGQTTDRWGRTGDAHPLQRPPWVLLGPVKAYFTTTEGGAAINEHCQVLRPDGSVIDGLYAVGQNGLGGMILWGHGLHIAWAMTSGRIAGHHAAARPGGSAG